MTDNNSSEGGIGFCGVLAIVFIVLKLTGTIGWSWWWVTSPLWIPWIVVLLIFAIYLIVAYVSYTVTEHRRKKQRALRRY